jgi:hypothetical protein
VKPEYPQHRKTRRVCRDARLLNIHLWNLADDEGRLPELHQWILGAVFPSDEDVTSSVLNDWLAELARVGLITRYEVDGDHYIQCHDFNDHQAINKKKKSVLPPCKADSEGSRTDPVALPEDSHREGKGREEEGKGKEAAAPARVAPIHKPILSKLSAVAFARNLTDPKVPAVVEANVRYARLDLEAEAEKFAHYYTEGPGERSDLSDVAWSWRNWLERVREDEPRVTKAPGKAGKDFSKYDAVVEPA